MAIKVNPAEGMALKAFTGFEEEFKKAKAAGTTDLLYWSQWTNENRKVEGRGKYAHWFIAAEAECWKELAKVDGDVTAKAIELRTERLNALQAEVSDAGLPLSMAQGLFPELFPEFDHEGGSFNGMMGGLFWAEELTGELFLEAKALINN